MNIQERIGLSVPEAAKALGISRTSLYKLMVAGELRFTKLNKRRVISPEALRELMERHSMGGVKP